MEWTRVVINHSDSSSTNLYVNEAWLRDAEVVQDEYYLGDSWKSIKLLLRKAFKDQKTAKKQVEVDYSSLIQ